MRPLLVLTVGILAAGPALAAAPDTLFVEVDEGVQLEVLDWGGDGPEVLLLAAVGNTAHVFEDFAPRLARHARVRGITRRGFGASTHSINGYDQRTLARDIVRVCQRLGIARPVLVGHSLAGSEMAWFEKLWPGRALALVFLDAAYDHSRLGELDDMAPHPATESPSRADKMSPQAVREWLRRARGFVAPLGEILALFRFRDDGRLIDATGSATAPGLIRHALPPPPYESLRAPALAIFARPTLAARYPAHAVFDDADLALARERVRIEREWMATQVASFQQAAPHAVVVVRDGANHHLHLWDGSGTAMAVGVFLDGLSD
ncbi:alpha/beta fold hydrolase [bacterium]|nr:alpha/beta fold hydrolase [bacterium]